ncbi:Ribosomal protein S18 acetylase RimI [Ferrimonas sediminum]|uniref:Ribosomal protein S18 acetylase RimI n=1 Tax=Ferrimonas sediminum TaxID=718193 RepID=A0A1G8N559_9GAMM|nr:GNAT family N-acetyltransferase [Ferrimonas sediminum]SDI75334.1 Ribosomal protein S18 acetylase RimI [Ferrimonas sediminum]
MNRVRKARADDAPRLWQLRIDAILCGCRGHYPRALLDRWTQGTLNNEFVNQVRERFWVIEQCRRVIASGTIDLDSGKLDAIFVCPSAMGTGVGRNMMNHLQHLALDAGLTQIHLEATLNAASFYRRLGFKGDTPSLYHSPRGFNLACILMHKPIA